MAPTTEGLPERLIQAIVDYAHHAIAESTWKAYETDLRHFAAWCDAQGLSPLPAAPTTVAGYLADHAPPVNATSTLRRRLASISVMHQAAGYRPADLPARTAEVKAVWSGIRRQHGVAPNKIRAARTEAINALVARLS